MTDVPQFHLQLLWNRFGVGFEKCQLRSFFKPPWKRHHRTPDRDALLWLVFKTHFLQNLNKLITPRLCRMPMYCPNSDNYKENFSPHISSLWLFVTVSDFLITAELIKRAPLPSPYKAVGSQRLWSVANPSCRCSVQHIFSLVIKTAVCCHQNLQICENTCGNTANVANCTKQIWLVCLKPRSDKSRGFWKSSICHAMLSERTSSSRNTNSPLRRLCLF